MGISTSTHVRAHAREVLIEELEAFATDREQHGKHERARLARAAAAELASGADRVFFERCYYTVGTADRYTIYTGTKDDVLRELDDYGRGQVHMGADGRAREAARALSAVQDGKTKVRVGDLVYEVVTTRPANTFTGSRTEVVAQIDRSGMRAARVHLKPEERELVAARETIRSGAERAVAAGTEYVVVGE